MYTFDSRIRYSEVGRDSKLTLLSLLDYFQDSSIFHSEDLGIGVKALGEMGCAWLLNYWQIDIDRFAELGERVVIETHPYEFKKFMGFRNFSMLDASGVRIAVANSLWTFLDMKRQTPTSPTQEMLEGYRLDPKAEMEYLPRKITVAGDGISMDPEPVRKHHLDTNDHVNNGQYVAIACEYIPQGMKVNRLRATYHKSAVLGDIFYPVTYLLENGIVVCLNDAQGNPYAMVEFTERTELHA